MASIWLTIDDFCDTTNLKKELVEKLISEHKLEHKVENGQVFIHSNDKNHTLVKVPQSDSNAPIAFAEKTIGTILNLHEKVIEAKDESISTLKSENKFLRDALFSMQELYDDDQKNVQFLQEQLIRTQEELEVIKRKYKLMWGKAGGKIELSPLIKDTDNKNQ